MDEFVNEGGDGDEVCEFVLNQFLILVFVYY